VTIAGKSFQVMGSKAATTTEILIDPEPLRELEPKLQQILTIVGIRTYYVVKVMGSKVKVICVQVFRCIHLQCRVEARLVSFRNRELLQHIICRWHFKTVYFL